MEVSSHSLELHRVDGTNFAVSVFTNLGRDHLDLHGSMEAYFEAKASLFVAGLGGTAVINADDPWGRRLLERIDIPSIAYAASGLDDVSVGVDHHGYTWRGRRVHVPIGGAFNVSNSLAAATAVSALGVPDAEIVEALREVTPVPGRFESVDSGQAFHVIVDYAHTPDGLDAVLRTARTAVEDGRLSVVFGCGGDRDRDKRPLMGAVAAATADLVFVTSDNPRSEDPRAIMDEIVRGIPDVDRDRVMVEPDRAMAMEAAFRLARPGDVVVVAGKGHEITQTIGNTVLPFDDRVMARRILEALQ